MKNKVSCMKGFTLIELLVVVLIIGILAAVALPQYEKAVEKARIATAIPVLSSIKTEMDLFLLENGFPPSGHEVFFLVMGNWELGNNQTANIADIQKSLDCSDNFCKDTNFYYDAFCGGGACDVTAYRSLDAYDGEGDYQISMQRTPSDNKWTYYCNYYDDSGERACNTLKGQGYEIVDGNE